MLDTVHVMLQVPAGIFITGGALRKNDCNSILGYNMIIKIITFEFLTLLTNYLNASRIPPGLYTMPGYLVRQVRVKSCIVCFLSRHNGPMPGCMGDVGMTRCGDILHEFLLKNAVAA